MDTHVQTTFQICPIAEPTLSVSKVTSSVVSVIKCDVIPLDVDTTPTHSSVDRHNGRQLTASPDFSGFDLDDDAGLFGVLIVI